MVTLTGTPGWAPISEYTVDFGDGLGYRTENQGNGITVVPPAPLVPAMIVIHDDGPTSLTYTVDTAGTTDSWSLAGATHDFNNGTGVWPAGANLGYVYWFDKTGIYRFTVTVTDVPVRMVSPPLPRQGCHTCY